MKTFIIDWGEGCQGGRYALVQAESLEVAGLHLDDVAGGAPRIAEFEIPEDCDGIRYLEITSPRSRFHGPKLKDVSDYQEWYQDVFAVVQGIESTP